MSKSSTARSNNFGLLRLAFAFIVIVTHSFEVVDGDRSREPLTQVFGTVSLGDLGVDGFFIVSGYLITKSFEASPTVWSYIWKRIVRIYPGFIVASLVCLVFVAPLSGADMASLLGFGWAKSLARMILLAQPSTSGAFNGQPHATLNAPMWTIAYEFRCYLLIAALGVFGILRRPVLLSMGIATLICSAAMSIDYNPPGILYDVFGTLQESVRFASMFLAGAVFYLYRDRADYRNIAAVIAAVFLAASLFNPRTAALAIPTLGAYLIFWFAFLPSTPNLNAINTSTDISYGVYLYGWPVQMLLVRFVPGIAPLSVVLLATLVSALLAYLSWQLIEKPCLSFKRGALVAALPR